VRVAAPTVVFLARSHDGVTGIERWPPGERCWPAECEPHRPNEGLHSELALSVGGWWLRVERRMGARIRGRREVADVRQRSLDRELYPAPGGRAETVCLRLEVKVGSPRSEEASTRIVALNCALTYPPWRRLSYPFLVALLELEIFLVGIAFLAGLALFMGGHRSTCACTPCLRRGLLAARQLLALFFGRPWRTLPTGTIHSRRRPKSSWSS